jgi:circadian clock protein KaiA
MLIPVLIWQHHVQKILTPITNLVKKQSLIRQMGNLLIEAIFTNVTPLHCHVFASYKHEKEIMFQRMGQTERQEFLQKLKSDYRDIIINYFTSERSLKEKIDKFINTAFYANIPVPQIIEIHMELIEELSKQLKLEGRTNETLLDYRLTLIDILAHLCELYRCSISSK